MKLLYLIRGIPGAGKSTLSKQLNVQVAIAADDYFTDSDGNYNWVAEKSKEAHSWCKEQVRTAMQSGYINSIAVHNTFTQQWEMQPYFDMAAEYDYRVTTLIVENRHGSKSIHNVPMETIKKMTDRFEVKLAPDIEYSDYVQIKEQNGLFIHKYKRSVFYNNSWDLHPDLKDARGLVTDVDGNIVQYPFTKVFNYLENDTTIPLEHNVCAVDKINGFMASVTWYNGDVLVSTTGSLNSDFVEMAKEILPMDKLRETLPEYGQYTFLFEIVHPNDPHIIQEDIGAYLLAMRRKQRNSPWSYGGSLVGFDEMWGVKLPNTISATFGEILDVVKTYEREGFVVYDLESDVILKLKSPYYLVSKFVARTKKLDLIFEKSYKQHFDEEFYGLCELLQQNYSKEQFLDIAEQDRLEIIREWARNAL